MIFHLGGDSILFTSAIVAIISTDALRAKGTRTFFARIKEQGRFVPCSGKAASLVIAQEKGETRVYASPVSCKALQRRCGMLHIRATADPQ